MPGPALLILGTGFGGFSVAKKIDAKRYDVSVVSPRNHFLFTPLLPSTTVGTIEFRSIIEPMHGAVPRVRFIEGHCDRIDAEGKMIHCIPESGGGEFTLKYDRLVVAVGSVNNYFHIPGVAEHALFLKELGDARAIRQRIIESLERANSPAVGDEERSRLLHFVVVGGGPTGVEFAAEMHDFLVDDLAKAFPGLVGSIRISLLEAAGHILGSFDTALAAYTIRHFQRQKIEVRMNSPVTRVDATGIYLRNGEVIPYGVLVWSTGVTPSPFLKSLSWPKSAEGRLLVDDHLRVRGIEDVFAIGDCAALEGKELPLTAQVAQQQGFYLARALGNLAVHKDVAPFRFRNLGMLAYIGGNRALADLAAVKWRGFSAWLFWRSAYLTRLVSLKNKVLVVFDWVKGRLFGRDISRF